MFIDKRIDQWTCHLVTSIMEKINQVTKILPFLYLGNKLKIFEKDFVKTLGTRASAKSNVTSSQISHKQTSLKRFEN